MSREAGPAVFSTDRTYRYWLERVWDDTLPAINFIGVNPSTADERKLDPTLRRVMGFAKTWGYGSFQMTNLFALRSKDPMYLRLHLKPVGEENDHWLVQTAKEVKTVVAAWGVHGKYRNREREVLRLLAREGITVQCLGQTKDGHPKHPLYLSDTTPLEPLVLRSLLGTGWGQ